MGLLDVLFKSAEKAATRAVKNAVSQKVNEVVRETVKDGLDDLIPTPRKSAPAPQTAKASLYDTTPDLPIPFMNMCGWLCMKGRTPEEVITILGLKNAQPANWKSGLPVVARSMLNKVFVVPVGEYVLALGYCPFGVMKTVKEELAVLNNIAMQVDEMSCFATQSVVDIHVWAKYRGTLERAYGWIGERGEVYINMGDISPEEISLGYTNLIQNTDCDWDTVDMPNYEHVHEMSKAWGVAPDLSNVSSYETSTGFVCDK